jgi:GntR family phosphonate transport system transcriptional regulator
MDERAKFVYKTRRIIFAGEAAEAGLGDGERGTEATRDATGALVRGSGVSAWRQIADAVREEIAAGRLPAGSRMPTEAELALRFGVNRHTLRRALAALAAEGLVRADQGRGTFVAERPLPYPIGRRTRFSAAVEAAARTPGRILLGAAVETATAALARRLALETGARLHRIETMSIVDGAPISVATGWLSADRFPDFPALIADTGSYTAAFARSGVADYVRLETRIRAALADAEDALRLGIPAGAAVLVTESVDGDAGGRPLECGTTRFAADRIELTVSG